MSYHYKYGHSVSIENVKHKLREGFIILGLNQFLKKLTKNCMFCKKQKNKPLTQRMADLPSYRFSMPLRAFSKVGIDFAGPFHIKQQGRGKPRLKSYILVFSCLQTRAVHLEATESQDTDSVLNAFSRFTSFRGMPEEVLSDNWKAFVTEDKELQSWVRYLDDDLIIKSDLANVVWHFTPPYGPHHGGTYEIMVKAIEAGYFLKRKILMRKMETADGQISNVLCVPLIIVKPLLESTHRSLLSGHFGSHRYYLNMSRKYYWPRMKEHIMEFHSNCLRQPYRYADPRG